MDLHNGRYVLTGHTPVPEPDLLTWAAWFEAADRHVADTRHEFFRVSTVFLGLDHQFGKGPPILFETMVFLRTGEPHDDDDSHMTLGTILSRADESIECYRYATWEDAEIGHQATVRRMLDQVALSGVSMPPGAGF